jgi:hypothetical protein
MKNPFIYLISLYQKIFFFRKRHCVFYPTCSEYSKEAISKYGTLKGIYLSFKRVIRCHPWQEPKIDKLK